MSPLAAAALLALALPLMAGCSSSGSAPTTTTSRPPATTAPVGTTTSTSPALPATGSVDGFTMAVTSSPAKGSIGDTTIRVTAVDMGSMMGGRARMRLVTDRTSAAAGTVSLVLSNAGSKAHELVVLPLAAGQQAGTRAVGADQKVDETGSLGEASLTGGSGAGDGIQPGTAGWTTLDLPAGRYEILCNLPGHYAAGMYAEITVN